MRGRVVAQWPVRTPQKKVRSIPRLMARREVMRQQWNDSAAYAQSAFPTGSVEHPLPSPGEFLCYDARHMANVTELSQQDIDALFDAMAEELASHGSEFTFIQLRMSAERLVVPLCGLSVEEAISTLKPNQYHVYLEKKLRHFRQGPVDLVLVPTADGGAEDWNTPYCFEFKVVWLRGIKGNIAGIKNDFEKLSRYGRGFIAAVLFSFDRAPDWAPYAHKGDMEQLAEEVVSGIGAPMYEGQEYPIASHETEGKIKLVAWAAGTLDAS